MTTEQAQAGVDLRLWEARPVHHPAVGDWHERRALMYTVGTTVVDFAELALSTKHRSSGDLLRAVQKRTRAGFTPRLWCGLRAEAEQPTGQGRPSTPLAPERDPRWLRHVEEAVEDVHRAAQAIREKGGSVCFPEQPLLLQLERAPYDFPDDLVLQAARRQAAYLRLRDAGALPSPPDTVMQIISLAGDEDSNLKQMAMAVSQDPAITAKVMQYVNSPLVGLRAPIASIDRAVVHLGRSALCSLALGFSLVSSHRTGPCEAFDYDMFWSEAVVRAVAARHIIGRGRKGVRADEAFTAGLLCQIGRLALATVLPEAYSAMLRHVPPGPWSQLSSLERTAFGIDHCELAGEMLADWNMPEFFWRAILRQHTADDSDVLRPGTPEQILAETLSFTDAIWRIVSCAQAPVDREAVMTVLDGAAQLGIPEESFAGEFDAIVDQWGEMGQVLDVSTMPVPSWLDLGARAKEPV